MISIPITLEQLIAVVKQLPPDEQAQVAMSLLKGDLSSDLTELLQKRYALNSDSENVESLAISTDNKPKKYDFSDLMGRLNWRGDAVEMQRSLRDEW
ncbi:hypothetical protein [Sphaerospermopsis torques-reginae]|jgi:hypothetical protein|uniref:Uncharacterized protein n=1 Tax=Sphaerospermopsis torques-reginae ITEP-024 TaxID=984208 RepID=A0ABX8X6M2_9CYAN|nr:hypothetical protein [Sphaerospermopsis torques-reginae]QYX34376.1 hypothetical protein K2F26_18585 [Sphaerospermopsis torques-reginae ITEP-024]